MTSNVSPLHARTKAVLHMSVPQAELFLSDFYPDLLAQLKQISKTAQGPLEATLLIRAALNTYLTHIRAINWYDTCNVLDHDAWNKDDDA